jgi:hypothetical protein
MHISACGRRLEAVPGPPSLALAWPLLLIRFPQAVNCHRCFAEALTATPPLLLDMDVAPPAAVRVNPSESRERGNLVESQSQSERTESEQ